MEEASRNEFNLIATPPPALARRLLALATTGAGSLNTSFAADAEAEKLREDRADRDWLMAMTELVAAVYRETQARLLRSFDIDDEASRRALDELDQLLRDAARERQQMIDAAVKRDDGTAVFLSEDGSSIYAEDGAQLSPAEASALRSEREADLQGGPRWEAFLRNAEETAVLEAEKADITRHAEERARLRADVERGDLSQDQLEELERDYEARTPERVQRHREASGIAIDNAPAPSTPETAAEPAASPLLARRFNALADPVPTIELPTAAPEPAPEQSAAPSRDWQPGLY